eukprot:3669495-Lingulodinium_polyedra.AAC.1
MRNADARPLRARTESAGSTDIRRFCGPPPHHAPAKPTPPIPHGRLNAARARKRLDRHRRGASLLAHGWN